MKLNDQDIIRMRKELNEDDKRPRIKPPMGRELWDVHKILDTLEYLTMLKNTDHNPKEILINEVTKAVNKFHFESDHRVHSISVISDLITGDIEVYIKVS